MKQIGTAFGFAAALALSALLWTPAARAQCNVPPEYVNLTTASAGDLQLTMGIDRFQCAVGDTVQFWLSAWNSGPATVVLPNPGMVSAIHSWAVLPDSCLSEYEPDGCYVAALFVWPEGVFFFGVPTPVAPGQCLSYTATWDGLHWHGNGPPIVPDSYRVLGGFHVGGNVATSQGAILPDMVVRLDITDGVPVVSTTWSGIKARFE